VISDSYHASSIDERCGCQRVLALERRGGANNARGLISVRYRTDIMIERREVHEVESIEPYGETGKYKINFKASAEQISPVKYEGVNGTQIQSIRYTSKKKLLAAKTIGDLVPWG
jgi:hypothetical protein